MLKIFLLVISLMFAMFTGGALIWSCSSGRVPNPVISQSQQQDDPPLNKTTDDFELDQSSIRNVIRQYFDAVTSNKQEDIALLIVNPPPSRRIFLEVNSQIKTSVSNTATNSSAVRSNSEELRYVVSKSSNVMNFDSKFILKLFPEYIRKNQLVFVDTKKLWLRDKEAKEQVNCTANGREGVSFPVYFFLVKDGNVDWKIYEIDLIDLKRNEDSNEQ